MLLAAIPALALLWGLGGRLTAILEREWRYLWLIWVSLGVQLVLFTPYGPDLPETVVRITHVVTYLPIIGFLVMNRDAGLAVTAVGIILNLVAITANGGLMPADATAQQVFYDGRGDYGNLLNTDNVSPRMLFLGDIMALPSWFPWANAFSIGDVLIAAGFLWAVAKMSVADASPSHRSLKIHINRPAALSSMSIGVPTCLLAGWIALGAALGASILAGHLLVAAGALVAGVIPALVVSADRLSSAQFASCSARLASGAIVTGAALIFPFAPTISALFAAAAAGALLVAPLDALRVRRPGHAPAPTTVVSAAFAAIGLAVGGTLLIGMAPAGPMAMAAILAIVTARFEINARSVAPEEVGRAVVSPFAVATATFGARVGLVGLGMVAVATAWHASGALGMGPRTFATLGSAVAGGMVVGLLMAARLNPKVATPVIGLAFIFCAAAGALLTTATLPMTVVAASLVLGTCVGLLVWFVGPMLRSDETAVGLGLFALGVCLGSGVATVADVQLVWIACLPVAAVGLALIPERFLASRRPALAGV
jgi:Family of unknown function (DUF5317)